MAIAPTVKYFGQHPTTIVMQTSSDFDGTTVQALPPVLTPGVYTFAEQAGGGRYGFHDEPIDVKNITYVGTGTLAVFKTVGDVRSQIASLTGTAKEYSQNTTVAPGERLEFVSSGGTGSQKVAVTAALTHCMWAT